MIEVINPATGDLHGQYETLTEKEALSICDEMHQVQKAWASTPFSVRADCLHRAAAIFREKKNYYAEIITGEMGKPISQARTEIEKCACLCEYYADEGEAHLKPQFVTTQKSKSYVCYKPLGVVFAIMPWNYPFWQVMRFAVPNVMGGNGGLLKHAPNSLGAGAAMEALFVEAGFPENLFRSIVIDVDVVPAIIHHDAISGVTLTGSERAGAAVAAEAGRALKKMVLELGGSDPYLILEDADLDLAAEQAVTSRLNNAGQVCIAAKRLIVVDSVYDAFLERVKSLIARYESGDPLDENTKLGPMARKDLRAHLHRQVQASIEAGARCVVGGILPAGPGCFYPATLLLDVSAGMPAFDEELFGPVVTLFRVKDEKRAIELANDTPYGLSACVFTRDVERGERIARDQLHAGTVSVNALVSSDPRLPFGGIKRSGYGRELAASGIHEFMNMKTVMVS